MINKIKTKIQHLRGSKDAQHFFRKLSGFSFGPIVNGLLGLITVPLLTFLISREEMGKASMYFTGQSLLTLIVLLGLDQVFVRDFYRTRRHFTQFVNLFLPTLLLSTIVLSIGFLFSDMVADYLFGEQNTIALVFFLASILIVLFRRYTSLIIRMHEHAKVYSFLQIGFKVLYTAALVFNLLLVETSYTFVIISHFTAIFLTFMFELIYVLRKKLAHGRIILSKKTIKNGINFGLPLVLASAMLWINNSFDKIAMRSILPIDQQFQEIGIYNVAFNLSNIMNIIKLSFTTFWIPVAYKWYNEKVSIKRFQKVNDAMTIALFAVGIGAFFSRGLLYYIIGSDFFESIDIFPFLMLVPLFYTSSEIASIGINIKKRTIYATIATAISAVVNIAGNLILIPHQGAKGAAIATATSFFIFFIIRSVLSNTLFGPIKIRLNLILFSTLFVSFILFTIS